MTGSAASWRAGAAALLLAGLSTWAIYSSSISTPTVQKFDRVSGRLSSVESPIQIDRVAMCSCFSGIFGQTQRKVSMRLHDTDSHLRVSIAGGLNSSVFLIVAYPNRFKPVLKYPDVSGPLIRTPLGADGVPANVTTLLAQRSIEVRPAKVADAGLAADLGISRGWTAYALPALPNKVAQSMGKEETDGSFGQTYPTWVTKNTLGPGETYFSEELGVGDWNFFIPLPSPIDKDVSAESVDVSSQELQALEKYFRTLGVAILSPEGGILGFAPTPPPSGFSSGGDL